MRRGMAGRSFLSQARHWIKAVIEATAPHVCAYKPSLGFYQALGPVGLDLLREVRELVPLEIPLIIDAKHGDLNSSSALAHYLFRSLGADAVTLSPLPGQDIAAPFLLYPDKAVVVTCHSSNPAARVLQHHPSEEDPLFLRIVRETQLWHQRSGDPGPGAAGGAGALSDPAQPLGRGGSPRCPAGGRPQPVRRWPAATPAPEPAGGGRHGGASGPAEAAHQ